MKTCLLAVAILLLSTCLSARVKPRERTLDDYLRQLPNSTAASPMSSTGSLWDASSQIADLAVDYKARHIGDPVVVQIVEQTSSESSGSVNTQRSFEATTGISGIAGKVNTGGVQDIFTGKGSSKLHGSGQSASKTQVRTTLSGQIVAITASGSLVVEARRTVNANNEKQTVLLRGVARPGDITSENTVLSSQLASLELELKGKGVISENTRPPNIIIRMLLRLVGF